MNLNPFHKDDAGTDGLNPVTKAFLGSIVRHGMTTAAGMLVANGYLTGNQSQGFVEQTSGVVLMLAGLGWSYYQKHQAAAK